MSEPPETPEPSGVAPPAGAAPAADATPFLLVAPAVEGAPPGLVWPGRPGEPAWAIPVQVPAGTRGYALFLPLLPAGADIAAPPSAGSTVPTVGPPATAASVAVPRQATGDAPTPAIPAQATGDGTTTVDGPAASRPSQVGEEAPVADPGDHAATEPGTPTAPDAEPTSVPEDHAATPAGTQATPAAPTQSTGGAPAPAPGEGTAVPAATPTGHQAAAPGVGAPGYPAGPYPAAGVPGQLPPAVAPFPGARPAPQWGGPPVTWTPRPAEPRTSFLGARWPGPKQATGRAVPAAVLAGALGVASFVPLNRTGIGWFLGWLVLTAAVFAAVRRGTAALPRTDRLIRAGWAAAALALLSVLTFRNAWWLVTFCVLGALGCAALAIIGGRLIRSILFSLVAAPFAAFRGLPWVRRHVTASPDAGMVRRVTGSVLGTVAVLLIFGLLLSSADAAFSEVLGAIVPEIGGGAVFRWIFLAVLGGLIAVAATYTLAAPPDLSTVDRDGRSRLSALEWAPAITALVALFAGFVAVQFTVLFGGQRHVLKTAGLSYAEYARSGFWQLLFVTLLTLAVLGGVSRWARRETRSDRLLLRILLGLLGALSVVIVVSALSRMYAYQKVYSFTGERIFVMAFELLLGAVLLMILVAGVRWRGRWIPGATVGLAVLMLLSLAVLNAEDYAARRNVARYEQTGKIDAWYLRALSADATPALADLPDPVRRCTLSWIDDDLAEPDPWYAWNLGRARARAELKRLGPAASGGPRDCTAADQYDLPKSRTPR
ncbi:DUF4153 domain-containing protein [Micromonospora sp. CPCC 205711]|uniref:DUF4153 domain-containing protein n=1 Tax=Micromonospora sp. CPCC 205547 TaxID=3122400 RepID=UPI002FF0E3A5